MPLWRLILNRLGAFLLGFIAFCFIVLVAWRAFAMPSFPDALNFAHAGGALDGQTYVNGRDAWDNSYANGFRYFETDFERTADGTVVCGHDWDAFNGKAPDLSAFIAYRAQQKHPVCTLIELVDWYRRHPDARLVSDAKDDVLAVDPQLHDELGSQLLAEAYDIRDVVHLGRQNNVPTLLSLYKLPTIPGRFATLMAMRYSPVHVEGVAMSVVDVWYGLALWSKIWFHAPVYVYTVNTCSYAPLLHLFGVDAIMTDDLTPRGCR